MTADLDAYPLTPVQQGLLFHLLLDGADGLYVQQIVLELDGLADQAALRAAWRDAVDLHGALRTGFYWAGLDEPLQVVEPRAEPEWADRDWSGLPQARQEVMLTALLAQDRRRGFALDQPPLLRLSLLRRSGQRYWLVVSHHHLILDGWSVSLLLGEVLRRYGARLRGEQVPPLSPPPFREHVAWLRARDPGQARAYWRTALSGVTRTPIPGVRPARPDSDDGRSDIRLVRLTEQESDQLAAFARGHGFSAATLGIAAWALVLAAHAATPEVLFDVTLAGRSPEIPDAETMLGMCIATVPVRLPARGGGPMPDWLRTVQLRVAEIQRHSHLPLVEIHGLSGVHRDEPLSESLVLFQNYADDWPVAAPDGLRVTERPAVPRTNYPLTVLIAPGQQWTIRVLYNTARCTPQLATRLAEAVAAVLLALPDDTAPALDTADDLVLAGTFTVQPVHDGLAYWAAELGLPVRVHTSRYGQLFQDLLDPDSVMRRIRRGAAVILVRLEDLAGPGADPADSRERSRLAGNVAALADALAAFGARAAAGVLVVVCPASPPWMAAAGAELDALTTFLRRACGALDGVTLVSADTVANRYETAQSWEPHADEAGHVPYTDEYLAALGTFALRVLLAVGPPPYAGYVFDADDTLWPGACAEGEGQAEPGSPWYALQRLVRAQARAGRLVGVATRNDAQEVRAALEHTGAPLCPGDLAGFRASWDSAAASLLALADDWQIPVESCLFITGNPVAHAEVSVACPGTATLLMPSDPVAAARFVAHLWPLDTLDTLEYLPREAVPPT